MRVWWLIHTFKLLTMRIAMDQERGSWSIEGCLIQVSSTFRPSIAIPAVTQPSKEEISKQHLNHIISNIRLQISSSPAKIDFKCHHIASKIMSPNSLHPRLSNQIKSLRTNPTTTLSLSRARRSCTWFQVYLRSQIWFPRIIFKTHQIIIYPL